MSWAIVTDSSCDIRNDISLPDHIKHYTIPFSIYVGKKEYIDSEELDVERMICDMESCKEASHTACASPESWIGYFRSYDPVIAITISSKLSGSYNSALAARNTVMETDPDKKIFILDSKSTGPALALLVEQAIHLIQEHLCFEDICTKMQEYVSRLNTVFGLCSFNNLIKSGRMNRISGILAEKLGIIGIGVGTKDGRISFKGKVRGTNRMITAVILDMEENDFHGGAVMISHCLNHSAAEKLRDQIKKHWPNARIKIMQTRGLCSFYAERKGLIVTY